VKRKANYILQEEENKKIAKKNHIRNHEIFWTKSNMLRSLKNFLECYSKKQRFEGPYAKIFKELKSELSSYSNNHTPKEVEFLKLLLLHFTKFSTLLEKEDSIRFVFLVLTYQKDWKKDIFQWKPKSHNLNKQQLELLQYLFETYSDFSKFLYKFWFSGNLDRQYTSYYKGDVKPDVFRRIYLDLTSGKSLRKIENLPFHSNVEISKRFAFYFNQVPENFDSIQAATIFCYLKIQNVSNNLIQPIVSFSRINHLIEHYDFWKDVFVFFHKNPMIDNSQICPIMDYIWHQKFYRGAGPFNGIEQPNFCIKHRNPLNLLKEVEKWHKKLAINKEPLMFWEGMMIRNYDSWEKKQESSRITIEQILNSRLLSEEGAKMKHCVFSSKSSCVSGSKSIWSVREDGGRKLTLALSNNGQVTEIRGKCNRLPSKEELKKIQPWLDQNKIKLSTYIQGI
jgi:hypothetical protein